MSEKAFRTHDLVGTGKTAEVRQLLSWVLGTLVQSTKAILDAEVTPEYEKEFLEDILPYSMDLGFLARYIFPVWGLRSVLGVHSDKVKQISGTPGNLV